MVFSLLNRDGLINTVYLITPDDMSSLHATISPHLEKRIDWDHEGVDRDLNEIADHMLDWEEKLSAHLKLTAMDIHDIKAIHANNPVLQR